MCVQLWPSLMGHRALTEIKWGALSQCPTACLLLPLCASAPLWMQGKQLRKPGLHRTAVFEEQESGDGGGGGGGDHRSPPL